MSCYHYTCYRERDGTDIFVTMPRLRDQCDVFQEAASRPMHMLLDIEVAHVSRGVEEGERAFVEFLRKEAMYVCDLVLASTAEH